MELIRELLDLLDQLEEANQIKKQTQGLWDQILSHMVKLYLFEKDDDKRKHIKDITVWAKDILRKLKRSSSNISYGKLYDWYDLDRIEENIRDEILYWKSEYLSEPVRSDEEVIDIVKTKMMKLLRCLSDKSLNCVLDWRDQIKDDLKVW